MSLSEKVLAFVSRARTSPVLASDPKFLDDLETAAETAHEGSHLARHIPVAEYTYEARVLHLGANLVSDRQPVQVPFDAHVVGMKATVTRVGGAGVLPTLDDIDVSIDIEDTRELITTGKGITTPGSNLKDGTFVTLATLDDVNRLHNLVLDRALNEIGVTFRWKAGAGVNFDCLICLAFYVRQRGLKRKRGASGK